jgi:hypothetical protein
MNRIKSNKMEQGTSRRWRHKKKKFRLTRVPSTNTTAELAGGNTPVSSLKNDSGSVNVGKIIKNKEGFFDTVRPLKSKMFIEFLSKKSSKKQLFNAIDLIRGKEGEGNQIVEIGKKKYFVGKIGADRSESSK